MSDVRTDELFHEGPMIRVQLSFTPIVRSLHCVACVICCDRWHYTQQKGVCRQSSRVATGSKMFSIVAKRHVIRETERCNCKIC